MSAFANALVLTGPTACGKSAAALEVAERINGEIVAMDSMTLYRGMDIGTAKPSAQDRARVPHHLIDCLDPWESASVAWWLERATEVCQAIEGRGHRPIFVGGTPFYLKSLLHGLFPSPPADETIRRQLEDEARASGNATLHRRLAAVDPRTAARLHSNDTRRVVRALEVFHLTGQPISEWQQTWDSPAFVTASQPGRQPMPIPAAVLELPRAMLYDRIDRRVDAMLAAGWLDEVRQLRNLEKPLGREAGHALGYRELGEFLEGKTADWNLLVATIRTRTRQFAKRQLTWFRTFKTLTSISAETEGLADRILLGWKTGTGAVE